MVLEKEWLQRAAEKSSQDGEIAADTNCPLKFIF
jgi:hypothetical protein